MLTRVTSEFQFTSCQCNKNKKIVHNAAMGQSAEVLGVFFPCDSFVVLYELFELFFAEGRMRAKRLLRQRGFIQDDYLTIFQLPSFLDSFLSTIPLSWSDATILETILLDIPILSQASNRDMLGLERRILSKVSSLSVRLSFFNVPFNVPWFFMTFILNFFIILLSIDSLIFREFFKYNKIRNVP